MKNIIKGAPARWVNPPMHRHPTPQGVAVPACYVDKASPESAEFIKERLARRMREVLETFSPQTLHEPVQIQALRVEEQLPWSAVWDSVSKHMCRLAEASPSPEKLEEVLQRLDRFSDMLEARLRVLLIGTRTAIPRLEPWISEKLSAVAGAEASRSCGHLLAALAVATPVEAHMVEVEEAPAGAVEIRIQGEVTWLVSPSTLPWPGIKARGFFPKERGATQLENKMYHLAPTLIDRTKLSLLDGSEALP